MVIGIIGENCTGKSTLAAEIQQRIGGQIVTGKDYLRLAKSEAMAAALFKKKLAAALTGENILYVISEQDQVKLLPEGAVRILVKADIDTIKERFRARMRGNLPAPWSRCWSASMACSTPVHTTIPIRATRRTWPPSATPWRLLFANNICSFGFALRGVFLLF